MPKSEDRTFYNLGDISKEFEKFDAQVRADNLRTMDGIQTWQVTAMLAIAQQLAVISGTLRDLLNLCESQTPEKKKAE